MEIFLEKIHLSSSLISRKYSAENSSHETARNFFGGRKFFQTIQQKKNSQVSVMAENSDRRMRKNKIKKKQKVVGSQNEDESEE